MQKIDEYINKAQHLVPAPHILPQLMPLLNRADSDNTQIVDLISYDTSLTASVLRVCNSAFYSRGTPIDNLLQAVTRLGSREVYRVVVAVTGAVTLSAGQKGYSVEASDLWKHSVTTAVAAQLIAKETGDDENVVFTAAILHDVGKIILAVAMESLYEKFIQETNHGGSLVEVEEKLLGCNHAEVGGRLLERWKLPANLVSAVRNHHKPSAAGEQDQRVAAGVYLGNFIAYFMGNGYGHHSLSLTGRDETLKILKIGADRLPQYMEACFTQLKQVKSLYNLK